MKELIQTIKLRRFKTEVNKEIIEKTYEGNYLVWFKDNSCQECYTKDDLIRLLEKDHIKPIRYIFNMSDRDFLVDKFFSDNVFSDLSNLTIFNFTNSIITKNVETLKQILLQFDSIDIEPIGVITVLYKNFKNILNVQLNSNPTPENTGLSSKQIWGIKNNSIGYFSKESLIDVFQFILSLDFKVKTGELPIDMLIDYVIVKVFNA